MAHPSVLVSGAGIAGLATALACGRSGGAVTVIERADQFGEVGAGIQIGPNVTRILHAWGLEHALAQQAAFPERLQVRSAMSARELAMLPLGTQMRERYGAPYATVHRADLHGLLLSAVRLQGLAQLHLGCELTRFGDSADGVEVHAADGRSWSVDALLGADGLWSPVRQQLLGDGEPQPTGHLAYRALLRQCELAQSLRSQQVTVWLGPRLHVDDAGARWRLDNLVVVVHGAPDWLRAAKRTPRQLANWSARRRIAPIAAGPRRRRQTALLGARLLDLPWLYGRVGGGVK